MYRLGSLFSGIGGFELGFEATGQFETVFQCEIDPFAQRILKKHWPNVMRFNDVSHVTKENTPPIDILTGGFPCQPHSLAGQRKASADERDLWGEFARVIEDLRPRAIVLENVRGLLSSEKGQFFKRVLDDLALCGYDAEWQVLRAYDVGAPHIRERVFIVGYPNSIRGQEWRRLQASANGTTWNPEGFGTDTVSTHEGFVQVPVWDDTKSGILRVADGLPAKSHRIKALGNAIVPQVAYFVAIKILESRILEQK
jgi:DNA (cytosine-5)-methyltransferase 1